ncbi:hypothetical protein ASPWEDRAFT_45532 [Aspergillus wentii DTO 134E9]|uniref:N-acetylglucosamine-induced protein 1 n=1 Tax=Aspergillus wentii DTO 134E9 TaxID=1073089 RepID=A0A1L9R9I8_ASPWE|nr:uncharacterized protein ASPWEDRAFT_45532 [Aspergillus wentii DTO 134E9]OJJ31569.1 hypothetical protein ASPWEDRAFT_45532 [Aspergillus wentii DTO 134E9]
MTDEEYVSHDWEDLKGIIARNDLGALKRKPSDLARYLAWSSETKRQFGSIMNFICQVRLQWHLPGNPSAIADSGAVLPFKNPIPFADPSDYKILHNDWPYGMAPGITHLVVWSRTPIPVKEDGDGDMTDESRSLIEGFIQRTFVNRLAKEPEIFQDPQEHVLWFKNWTALQSVRALDHAHILVRDVPNEIIYEWTGESPPKN